MGQVRSASVAVVACLLSQAGALCQGVQKPMLVPQTGHATPVASVAFSPDCRTLASGSEDGTIDLWDAATGRMRATLRDVGAEKAGLPGANQPRE